METNFQISGSLPQLPPPQSVMESLSTLLGEDIIKDVEAGGNPRWQNRIHPPGQATLGYIRRTLQLSSGENFARASFGGGDSSKYAAVHEMGWEILRTQKMKRFFWAKYYESGKADDFWKNMALSKKQFITIPPRPVVSGIFARKEDYARFIGQRLVVTHSVPISKG